MRRVVDAVEAAGLAAELSVRPRGARGRPRVVVTTAPDRDPLIDVDALSRALGDRAEVVLVVLAFAPPATVRPATVPPGQDTAQAHLPEVAPGPCVRPAAPPMVGASPVRSVPTWPR